ncbi:hypothetical protein ACI782_24920, partial [Geodermatophilus sp. SYSU D00703]
LGHVSAGDPLVDDVLVFSVFPGEVRGVRWLPGFADGLGRGSRGHIGVLGHVSAGDPLVDDVLVFSVFPGEVRGVRWLPGFADGLGRGSRRRTGVLGHVSAGQPLVSDGRVEHLGSGSRRDLGLNVLAGCHIGRVPDVDDDPATAEHVASPALEACPRRKTTKSRHARRCWARPVIAGRPLPVGHAVPGWPVSALDGDLARLGAESG